MSNEVVSQRLKQAMADAGLTAAQLSRNSEVSKGYISKILSDSKSNLSADYAAKLAKALRVDVAWLLGVEHGPGGLLVSSPMQEAISHKKLFPRQVDLPMVSGNQPAQWQRVRLVPIVAYVQGGQAIDFETVPLEDHDVVPSTCRDPGAFALILRGISMEPLYSEDSVIIVSPAKEKRYESLVVAQLTGVGVTFKLLDVPSTRGMIRLTAYNPAFAPIERPEEDFDWVHAVHSVIKYERA